MGKNGATKTGGRKRGTPNKVSKQVKDMVLGALDDAGGQSYLARQAEENPSAFLGLVKAVLPLQVNGEITGGLEITWQD
jgi:hypothetical protein